MSHVSDALQVKFDGSLQMFEALITIYITDICEEYNINVCMCVSTVGVHWDEYF